MDRGDARRRGPSQNEGIKEDVYTEERDER